MGGGGSFNYYKVDSDDIIRKIKESEKETDKQEYETWVRALLDKLLGKLNNRDTEAIAKHIQEIKNALNKEIDGTISTLFGGSVAKNTHTEGLSDIDTLVILNNTELSNKTPKEVLDYFVDRLKKRFPNTDMIKGDKTITVKFADSDVQLIPAVKYKTGIKIPDADDWSKIVQPSVFARKLTVLNGRLDGKLIPTIKLVKGIISTFPSSYQLKGYHIENLALQVFENKVKQDFSASNLKRCVVEFFKEAPKYVKKQIKDVSGQSRYVDEYLGKKDNIKRLMVADTLERTFRQLELSDAGNLKSTWKELLSNF